MAFWAALAGGFVATVVMTVLLEAAGEAGLTRLDVAYLLGSAFRRGRVAARALGYVLHLGLGLGFAVGYAAALDRLGAVGWAAGAVAGLLHGALAATLLFPLVLTLVHPRLAVRGGDRRRSVVEPPGLLGLGYGRATPAVLVGVHVAYGTIVGGFVGLGS